MIIWRDSWEATRAFNLACLELEGYEADDIIGHIGATGARGGRALHDHVAIVSRDKDLMPACSAAAGRNCLDCDANRRRYRNDVFNDLGIYPEQIPDYLGLVGDSVDCISGVPGSVRSRPRSCCNTLMTWTASTGISIRLHSCHCAVRPDWQQSLPSIGSWRN